MSKISLTFSEAVAGHRRMCQAAGYSPNTLADYQHTFRIFLAHLGQDMPLRQITSDHIEDFMIWAQTTPVTPKGIAPRGTTIRSPKTIKNYHTGLSSLWTWAVLKRAADTHIVHPVKSPKVNPIPIQPNNREEMRKLVASTRLSRQYKNNPLVQNERPTHARDQMVICLLYETMIRASELVKVTIGDIHFKKPGGTIYIDLGKGKKSRYVSFGKRCSQAIQDYLLTRPDHKPTDYLLVNSRGRDRGKPMKRDALGRLVKRLGQRAGVKANPHLLRTTGACHRLNQNCNPVELQHLMGHSDITTTMRYVAAAKRNEETIANSSPLDTL